MDAPAGVAIEPFDPGLQIAFEAARPGANGRIAPQSSAKDGARPAIAILSSLALHLGAIALVLLVPAELPAAIAEIGAIEVEIMASVPEQTPSEASPPVEQTATTPEPLLTPEPPAPLVLPEAAPLTEQAQAEEQKPEEQPPKLLLEKQLEPEAEPISPPPPLRPAASPENTARKAPAEPPRRVEASERRLRQRQAPQERTRRAAPAERKAQGSEQAQTAAASNTAARVSYGALIVGQINAHKFYPPAAREQAATGAVGIQFSIDRSGRVSSVTITRSSGNAALDAAARQAVLAVAAPPPPGGSFAGATTLRFNLAR